MTILMKSAKGTTSIPISAHQIVVPPSNLATETNFTATRSINVKIQVASTLRLLDWPNCTFVIDLTLVVLNTCQE
jgi:hypothetical protein